MGLNNQSNGRTLFLRYLTNGLSTTEQEEFESRLLGDHEFSDEMAVCEQELIDAYATQALTASKMAELKPWIENSSKRLQRVEMAQALLRQKQTSVWMGWRTATVLGLAACFLLAIGLVLAWSSWQKKQQPQAESSKAHTPAGNPSPAPLTVKPDVILVVAERIRGDQKIPTFAIHPAHPVQLGILLTTDVGSDYSVRVISTQPALHPVFEQQDLKPQSANGQSYLSLSLPAESLHPGTYDVVVKRGQDTLIARLVVQWRSSPE